MITLTAKEIINIVKKKLTVDTTIHGASDLKEWILSNGFDNHGWIKETTCHYAMKIMVEQGILIKQSKNNYFLNPLKVLKPL